jgi:hypothetical protein
LCLRLDTYLCTHLELWLTCSQHPIPKLRIPEQEWETKKGSAFMWCPSSNMPQPAGLSRSRARSFHCRLQRTTPHRPSHDLPAYGFRLPYCSSKPDQISAFEHLTADNDRFSDQARHTDLGLWWCFVGVLRWAASRAPNHQEGAYTGKFGTKCWSAAPRSLPKSKGGGTLNQ